MNDCDLAREAYRLHKEISHQYWASARNQDTARLMRLERLLDKALSRYERRYSKCKGN
jgi:hypothetical protein